MADHLRTPETEISTPFRRALRGAGLGFALSVLLASSPVLAGGRKYQLLPDSAQTKAIPGLKVDSSASEKNGHVLVRGTFESEDHTLVILEPELREGLEKKFEVLVPVSTKDLRLEFASVAKSGQVTRQAFILRPEKEEPELPRHLSFSPGIGVSHISYRQTTLSTVSLIALTPKVSLEYPIIPERWIVGLSFFMTTLPIHSNQPGLDFKFVGGNLRFGRVIGLGDPRWRLSLMAGYYYATTSGKTSRQGTFGYKNVNSPQFYPAVRRTLAKDRSIYFYVKLSPIFYQGSFKVSNREIAGGTGFSFAPNAKGRAWGITLDVAFLDIKIIDGEIHSQSITSGVAYYF